MNDLRSKDKFTLGDMLSFLVLGGALMWGLSHLAGQNSKIQQLEQEKERAQIQLETTQQTIDRLRQFQ